MLPTMHSLAKTATDLRRSINRLINFQSQNPDDPHVVSGVVQKTIEELKEARKHIPTEFLDTDLLNP